MRDGTTGNGTFAFAIESSLEWCWCSHRNAFFFFSFSLALLLLGPICLRQSIHQTNYRANNVRLRLLASTAKVRFDTRCTHARSIKSANLSKHRKQSTARDGAQHKINMQKQIGIEKICSAKCSCFFFVRAPRIPGSGAYGMWVTFFRWCCGRSQTAWYEQRRMISVCQFRLFVLVRSFGSSSFGSQQSVYHSFSAQSRVSILAVAKSRRQQTAARIIAIIIV